MELTAQNARALLRELKEQMKRYTVEGRDHAAETALSDFVKAHGLMIYADPNDHSGLLIHEPKNPIHFLLTMHPEMQATTAEIIELPPQMVEAIDAAAKK